MSNPTPARSRFRVLGTLCGLLLLSTIASNALQNEAPVLLKLKFKPNDVTKYKVTMTQEQNPNIPGQDNTPHVVKVVASWTQKISKVLPDGGAEVTTTVTDQKMTVDDMDAPAQELPTVTTVYDAKGNVKSTKGLGGIMQNMMGDGMTSGLLSEKPVKTGDTWTLPLKSPGATDKATVKDTFLKTESVSGFRTARIRSETTAPMNMLLGSDGSPVTNVADAIIKMTGTMTGTGEVNFAIEEGKIVRMTSHKDVNMMLKALKSGVAGVPESGQMRIKQSITMEVVP